MVSVDGAGAGSARGPQRPVSPANSCSGQTGRSEDAKPRADGLLRLNCTTEFKSPRFFKNRRLGGPRYGDAAGTVGGLVVV